METPREDVCFICKRTAYITKCQWCLYNNLKKKWTDVENAERESKKPTNEQKHYDAMNVEKN